MSQHVLDRMRSACQLRHSDQVAESKIGFGNPTMTTSGNRMDCSDLSKVSHAVSYPTSKLIDDSNDDEEYFELEKLPDQNHKYTYIIRPKGLRRLHVKQSPSWQRKHLAAALSVGCCKHECLTNFNFTEMLQYTSSFSQLDEAAKSQAIHKSLLESITHQEIKGQETHTVAGLQFNFSWKGISLCPKAFAVLHSISHHKLTAVAEMIGSNSTDTKVSNKYKIYKENCNNEAAEIFNFLNYMKTFYGYSTAETDNITWLSDITLKSDVYEMLCDDFQQQNKKPPTLPYFYSVWKQKASNIIPEGLKVVCSTCQKLHSDMDSTNAEISSIALEQLSVHMAKQKALRDLYELLRVQAREDPRILVLIGDHMRSKFLPKFTRHTQQSLMTDLFEFAVSGWYNCRKLHTDYYLFGEHFKESSDTIISCLHQYLKDYYDNQEELYLIFDRHSTQANNLLMGYLEWLVRFKKMFNKITVIFLESGHTKTILDAEHKNIAQAYYSHELFSIEEYVHLIASKTYRHKACWFQRLFDFNKCFELVLHPIPSLQAAHIFEITEQGTRTKIHPDEAFSDWRRITASPDAPLIEPFFFLSAAPSGELTPLQPRQSAFERVKAKAPKILDLLTTVPIARTKYLRDILDGKLGYELNFKELAFEAPVNQPSTACNVGTTQDLNKAPTNDGPDNETQEWTIDAVFNRKFALNKDNTIVCMFLATYRLDNNTTQNEWQQRQNFCYETASGKEINKSCAVYEESHPYKGKNQSRLRKLELTKQPLTTKQIAEFKLKYRVDIEGPVKGKKRKHNDNEEKTTTRRLKKLYK